MNIFNLFKRKEKSNKTINQKVKKIKYLTLNGFEVRMSPKGFKRFEMDNKETIKHWKNLLDERRNSYYRTKEFKDVVVVYVGRDFKEKPLLNYVEENYQSLI